MKIAIDASALVYGTGVSVYTKNLIENLLKIDDKNQYLICGYSLRRIEELKRFTNKLGGNFSEKFINFPPTFFEVLWNKYHLVNFENIYGKTDVYHSSDWAQAPSKAKKVTTIHDLIPILFPEYSLPRLVEVNRRRLEIVKREVNKIIVPSKQTKADLLKLNFNEERIVVIPEAVDSDVKPASSDMKEVVKKKFSINKPFFMAVGITPRKNIDRITKAFDYVNKANKFDLVVVGEAKIDIKGGKNVIFTNYVSRPDLIALYSSAIALVYPSLYEGFGLPVLEALKCRVPVVTSNFGALLEVGKESCILVDPFSVDSIADGMKKAISADTINNVDETLQRYSWKNTAKLTLEVYESLKI